MSRTTSSIKWWHVGGDYGIETMDACMRVAKYDCICMRMCTSKVVCLIGLCELLCIDPKLV